jgi:RNA polymerase primary sigma factor
MSTSHRAETERGGSGRIRTGPGDRRECYTLIGRYLHEIRDCPLLTREEEARLARGIHDGDLESMRRMIESNLSFVVKVAGEYRNRGLPFEDLLSEGNLGLMEAARRFDPTRGNKFITYATWWIRKAILQALRRQTSMVRIPTYQMEKVKQLRETRRALHEQLGRAPRRQEVCEELDQPIESVDRLLLHLTRAVSLDERVGREREVPLADLLVDRTGTSPEASTIRRDLAGRVRAALDTLGESERKILGLRFGLGVPRLETLREIGQRLGMSRERVRQIEQRAKARLRALLGDVLPTTGGPDRRVCEKRVFGARA